MTDASTDTLFSSQIFPGFPFSCGEWIAMAFERNSHDNARIPEWFFRAASSFFNPDGNASLLIKGDCFILDGCAEVKEIAFEWESYHGFMLSPDGFSLEYKMASEDGQCGCWADSELAVFGGTPKKMLELINENGGRDSMLARMVQEFLLGDVTGNEDMLEYFTALLFPDRRGNQ